MVKSVVDMKDKAKITQRDINALPQGVHKIESNFYVRVRDNRRTYIFKATIEGKRREIGLGSAYEVSFAIARSKALKLKSQIASGEELFVDKLKEEAKGPIVITFDSIADEAIEVIKNRKRWRSEKHSEQWKRTVRVYASPVFGSKPRLKQLVVWLVVLRRYLSTQFLRVFTRIPILLDGRVTWR